MNRYAANACVTEIKRSALVWVASGFLFGIAAIACMAPSAVDAWLHRSLVPDLPIWLLLLVMTQVALRRRLWPKANASVMTRWLGLGAIPFVACLLPLGPAFCWVLVSCAVYAWCIAGPAALRAVWPTLVLLAVGYPLPEGLEHRVVAMLCDGQAWLASSVLPLVTGHNLTLRHNTLYLADAPGTALCSIEPTCSGLRSMMGLMLLGLLVLGDPRAARRSRAIVLLSVVPLGFIANACRINLSAFSLAHGYDWPATGAAHHAAGLVALTLSVVLLVWIAGYIGKQGVRVIVLKKAGL